MPLHPRSHRIHSKHPHGSFPLVHLEIPLVRRAYRSREYVSQSFRWRLTVATFVIDKRIWFNSLHGYQEGNLNLFKPDIQSDGPCAVSPSENINWLGGRTNFEDHFEFDC